MTDLKKLLEGEGLAETTQQLLDAMNKTPVPLMDEPGYRIPQIHIPSHQEVHEYQSASVFMEAVAREALRWKESVPEDSNPAILALLYGGIQISVRSLSQVSFHGIMIEGLLNGAQCSLLAHQSTVQVLCYAEKKVEDESRNPIGFIWGENVVEV